VVNKKIHNLKKVKEGEIDIPDPNHGAYTTDHHENIIAQDRIVENFGQHISDDGQTYEQWYLSKDTEQLANIFSSWRVQKAKKIEKNKNQQGLKENRATLTLLRQKFDKVRDHVMERDGKTIEELLLDNPLTERN